MAGRGGRVTRADVAKKAGVSETIVSYVINNNRYVDKEKRRLVEEAVRELHYRPNSIARALKGKSSNHIIFIADQIANEHFGRIISEMDKTAYEMGYMISLCSNRNSEEFLSQILSHQYDGVVISSISFPGEYIRRLIDARMPLVLLRNRDYEGLTGAGMIDTGLYEGARSGVRHLVERGRRRILYLDRFSRRGHFSTMEDLRYRGFLNQMSESALPCTEENIITGCRDASEVFSAVQRRISLEGFPADAIFGRNDSLAAIGMQAVEGLGYKVPTDIAVMGFDNSSLSRYTSPPLTTVELPRAEIAKAAVEMLHRMIEEETVPTPVVCHSTLIKREST